MHMRCTSDMAGLGKSGLKRLYADERGNAKRTVLLLILLLVLVAAAVFLLFPDLISPPAPEPVKPAQNQVKRKVVQLPQKPEKQPAAEKPAEKAAEKPAEKTAATQPEAAASTDAPSTGAPAVAETKPAAAPEKKMQVAAEEKPQAAAAPAPKPVPKAAAATPVASAPGGAYTVTAGAYLLSSSVKQADKSIRDLGFTPNHSKIKRDIEVIRLKEGTYGEAEARARVAQYKREFSDDAFALKEANGWTVYLGSYVGLDRARVHADRLYALGVRVTEVKAVVPMTLTLVSFGGFPDQTAAQKIVVKAKAAGLDAYVSKVK